MNNQNKNKSYTVLIIGLAVIILLISILSEVLFTYHEKNLTDITSPTPSITIVLFIIGIILTLAGITKLIYTKKYCTYRVYATCIDIDKNESYDSEYDHYTTMYSPIYEFYHNGDTFKVKNSFYFSRCNVQIGEQVELLINPDKPKEFIYANGRNYTHGILILSGVIFIVTGILVFITFYN